MPAWGYFRCIALIGLVALCLAGIIGAQDSADKIEKIGSAAGVSTWLDDSTGLMWATQDNKNDMTWQDALRYCHDLSAGGFHDWFLPSVDEFESVSSQNTIHSISGFEIVRGWTRTKYSDNQFPDIRYFRFGMKPFKPDGFHAQLAWQFTWPVVCARASTDGALQRHNREFNPLDLQDLQEQLSKYSIHENFAGVSVGDTAMDAFNKLNDQGYYVDGMLSDRGLSTSIFKEDGHAYVYTNLNNIYYDVNIPRHPFRIITDCALESEGSEIRMYQLASDSGRSVEVFLFLDSVGGKIESLTTFLEQSHVVEIFGNIHDQISDQMDNSFFYYRSLGMERYPHAFVKGTIFNREYNGRCKDFDGFRHSEDQASRNGVTLYPMEASLTVRLINHNLVQLYFEKERAAARAAGLKVVEVEGPSF